MNHIVRAFFVLVFIVAGCGQMPTFAQDKPQLKVKLSVAEIEALNSLNEKLTANRNEGAALMQRLRSLEAEIAMEHPGYHFDEASGQIIPNPAAEPKKDDPAMSGNNTFSTPPAKK